MCQGRIITAQQYFTSGAAGFCRCAKCPAATKKAAALEARRLSMPARKGPAILSRPQFEGAGVVTGVVVVVVVAASAAAAASDAASAAVSAAASAAAPVVAAAS